jgi:hypothetical protein
MPRFTTEVRAASGAARAFLSTAAEARISRLTPPASDTFFPANVSEIDSEYLRTLQNANGRNEADPAMSVPFNIGRFTQSFSSARAIYRCKRLAIRSMIFPLSTNQTFVKFGTRWCVRI